VLKLITDGHPNPNPNRMLPRCYPDAYPDARCMPGVPSTYRVLQVMLHRLVSGLPLQGPYSH